MKKWLEPKDLIHSFNVEKLINEFVESIGGNLVSELIPNSPDFENADYFFQKENLLIELKCLQTDFPQSAKFSKKVAETYENWLMSREITSEMMFNSSKLPREKRVYLNRIYSEPLRRIIKKANRQLRSTEQYFSLKNCQKLLFIVNDGLFSFEPPLLISIICNILSKEFSSIDGFVYFNVNSYVEVEGNPFARQFWIPTYSPKASVDLPDLVNLIGGKWGDFFGNKIGGYDDRIKTDDGFHLIANSRNIIEAISKIE
jgi:hypothetical protein